MADLQKLPVIPDDRADDLHNLEIIGAADLALLMAGNQFMVMPALIKAFQQQHPDVERVYYQTLPPGLSLKQILAGGARFKGQALAARADVYASVNKAAMEKLAGAGHVEPGEFTCYLHNRLTLMVPAGNPANIETVRDLGKENIRISQPDPANEDIGLHIMDMYRAAGGDALVQKIMEQKRDAGTAIFTRVHHRETPLRIELGNVDVGPVWATEVEHARTTGRPIDAVEPGVELDQRNRVNYYIARLTSAPNSGNAEKFIEFITSPTAREIYRGYGFVPPAD